MGKYKVRWSQVKKLGYIPEDYEFSENFNTSENLVFEEKLEPKIDASVEASSTEDNSKQTKKTSKKTVKKEEEIESQDEVVTPPLPRVFEQDGVVIKRDPHSGGPN